MQIKHLTHNNINLKKWDACIQNARNPLVYAESFYLDVVSPNWEALVLGDYEYVMPLPVRKKFGITFIVQPTLTQQLGIFSKKTIDENVIERFIKKIPYRSFHLNLNEQNFCRNGIEQPNYVLGLNADYKIISSNYSGSTKKSLKKSQKFQIEIKEVSASDFLSFYHATGKNYPIPPKKNIDLYINELSKSGRQTLMGVYHNNVLVAALCLIHSPERLIYMLSVANAKGRELSAMSKAVDELIKKYSNQNLVLDFEGSKVENVASFYQGFGATLQPYYTIKRLSINDLRERLFFWRKIKRTKGI